jgi:2-amino-4-hydroxy-6-hydroxymethyldihydropteridine diphosphokinase
MARVAVSIGSNLQRDRNVKDALAALSKTFGAISRSSVYESAAYGFDGPPFYNLVVVFETLLDVHAVRGKIQFIENQQGREIGENRSGSRSLDLDLLLYGDAIFHDQGLDVPRREIFEHAYILKPLADLLPTAPHPVTGETFSEIWLRLGSHQEAVSVVDGLDLN